MKKQINIYRTFFVLFTLLMSLFSYGQKYYEIKGIVSDENNEPLVGASVIVDSLNQGTVTDEYGQFYFENLGRSQIKVTISYLGYETMIQSISLTKTKTHKFQLKESTQNLNEVILKDSYIETKTKETSLNIEMADKTFLKQNQGGSLMKSLERLPGISTIDIGSGQSKPVIRGLGFNRVVVVENNIKHEAQQWGADHGLEIDQYAVEHVEIIKGPASLMYGSDAIGGVIDMQNNSLPTENTFGGSIDLTGKTNNDFIGTSLNLYGRKKHFFATARLTFVDYGDYKVPTDSVDIYNYRVPLYKNQLRNTAGKELNLHTSFGIVKTRFQSKFYVSNVRSKSGFFANAHGLEPRNVDHTIHDQSSRDILYPHNKVNHFKIINKSQYWSEKWNLALDLGYQQNLREEWSQYVQHGFMPAVFPDHLDINPELERQFKKNIYSANAKLFYEISKNTELNVGLNSEYKQNEIGGRGLIIPAFKQLNLGNFTVLKHKLYKHHIFQVGIRFDYGKINIQNQNDWFSSPIIENGDTTFQNLERFEHVNRDFFNFSWSLGYNFNPNKWSYKFNVGKSFRIPIAKELGANGVNYHRFSYEVGNSNLSPEISYQLDAGVEYRANKFSFGASPFLNYFSNYIYLNPTSKVDRLYGFGNQVYEYTEAEVFRYGSELHAEYNISNHLQLGIIGEFVVSEQLTGPKKGFTLPFSPPASAIVNIKYQKSKMGSFHNPYFSLDWKLTTAQNNIVPPEEITKGNHSINFGLGGDVFYKKQKVNVSVQIQNLFNQKYFNHTSYYRLINVPEPGRNIIVNVSLPFSKKI